MTIKMCLWFQGGVSDQTISEKKKTAECSDFLESSCKVQKVKESEVLSGN